MTDPETRLTAALQADAPPGRDTSFRVDVLVRLEQSRFRRQVGRSVIVAAVVAVLAAGMTLSFDAWISETVWIVALGAPVAVFAIFAGLVDTPTAVGTVVRTVGRWLYQ